jgi:hypothetical protein
VDAAERRDFVRNHWTAIFGYSRKNDGPSTTVVYYVTDGEDILVSTTATRSKARAVARNSRASLSVLDESWPFACLTVYCNATVDATVDSDLDAVASLYKRIFGTMLDRQFDDGAATMTSRGQVAGEARRANRLPARSICWGW